jgi:hypothetical protein
MPGTHYDSLIRYVDGVVFGDVHPEVDLTLDELFGGRFEDLCAKIRAANLPVDEPCVAWWTRWKDERLSEFLKAKSEIGKKRLVSYPERSTNPVSVERARPTGAAVRVTGLRWKEVAQRATSTPHGRLQEPSEGVQALVAALSKGKRTFTGAEFAQFEINGLLSDNYVLDSSTNTIYEPYEVDEWYRPSIVSMDEKVYANLEEWWTAWIRFMFDTDVMVAETGTPSKVCTLIQPMMKGGTPLYDLEPDVAQSRSLQILCLAVFDATLMHVVLQWQTERRASYPEATYVGARTEASTQTSCDTASQIEVLQLVNADVMLLQEVSNSALAELRNSFGTYTFAHSKSDTNQMSVVALSKARFETLQHPEMPTPVALQAGMCAVTAVDKSVPPKMWLVASFHAVSNGTDTPKAFDHLGDLTVACDGVLFGLDANTVAVRPADGKKHYLALDLLRRCDSGDYVPHINKMLEGLDGFDVRRVSTTFKARTALQPQFDKTMSVEEVERGEGDQNPKDWILVGTGGVTTVQTMHDASKPTVHSAQRINCVTPSPEANLTFTEGMNMPSASWPSDHAMIRVTVSLPAGQPNVG